MSAGAGMEEFIMKHLIAGSTLALLAVISLTIPANAQFNSSYRHGYGYGQGKGNGFGSVNATQSQLSARINQGIRSGRLSQNEASKLRSKLAKIAQLEARMRASGNRLTASERNTLRNQLTNLSAQITRELNDAERRRVGYWNNNRRFR